MKAARTTATATAIRSAKAIQTPSTQIRFSSSEAGPSTPSSSRRLPRPVLRNLVDLHHHSSTFLQDTSTFSSGFRTAFNTLHTPFLAPYKEFATRARSLHATRSLGGLDVLRKVYPSGAGAIVSATDHRPQELRVSRSAWTGEQSWANGQPAILSERETLVKEALYGSWFRGVARDRFEGGEVGLEGVEEFAEAREKRVEEDAGAWKARHEAV